MSSVTTTSLPIKRQLETLDDKRLSKKQHYDDNVLEPAVMNWNNLPFLILIHVFLISWMSFIIVSTIGLAINLLALALIVAPFKIVEILLNKGNNSKQNKS
eukprot:NODE_252_length_11723_cov_1.965933.p12 type:complete len:101 gc:universal NODE_252_length_11723_cov_1.965933:1180-1482(+)